MADRQDAKEEARAEREALEAQAADSARRQRAYRLGAIVVFVLILAAIAIAIGSSSTSTPSPLAKGSSQTEATVARLLSGIPQSGNRLGSPSAPVVMTEFGDLECPVCADLATGPLDQLIAGEVRAGRVQVLYRALQTATQDGATFKTQQLAALAAGRQQRMWNYIELFYREQGAEGSGYVTPSYLRGLARQVQGLDIAAWATSRSDPSLGALLTQDEQLTAARGYSSTPTLVFQGPRGTTQPLIGVPAYSDLQQAIRKVS